MSEETTVPKRDGGWKALTEKEKKARIKKMLAARKKNKQLALRPDPSMIETLEVPIHGEQQTVSRLDRLAALIVAVEKLL